MKTLTAALWLILAAAFLTPMITCYSSGIPESEIMETIRMEAESDRIEIFAQEERGNKVIYAFSTGADYGVAVFSHVADNYRYEEGILSNGQGTIDVNLDTGWDIYEYEVTGQGMEMRSIREGEGIYKSYATVAAILAAITAALSINGRAKRRRKKKNGKKLSEDI